MAATYIFGGQIIDTVVYDEVELVESADLGSIGQSSLTIFDEAGTLNVIGLKTFKATESDCGDRRTLRGFVEERTYERGVAEASNSRTIRVSVSDVNDLLAQRALVGKDAKRPRETVNKRVNWLLGTPELGDLVSTSGRVNSSTEMMDKADHRNSFPGDVLMECAQAAGNFNYYVFQDPDDGEPKLSFRNDNTSNGNTSVLAISNVPTSIGSNVFAPMDEATLTRSPENTFSKALVPYARGTTTETRVATASNYQRRDGIAPNSNVKSAERASKLAREFLYEHRQEEDSVDCEIEVPGGAVNLVHAGDRIACQFGHWGPEGYAGWTYFRVLERRVKPQVTSSAPSKYRIGLKLSPQEPAEPTCSYARTESGVYYPLGGREVPLSATPGDTGTRAISDGFSYYVRPGDFYPTSPDFGHYGRWHFGEYGVGGPGTIDYAGDCVQNTLQFIVVGNGTLTVQTEAYWSGSRPMGGSWGTGANAYLHSIGDFTSGESVEFVIDDTSAPNDCIRLIRLYDGAGSACGGKWGWSSATWAQS